MRTRRGRAVEFVVGVALATGTTVGALLLLDVVVSLRELGVGLQLLILGAVGVAGPRLVAGWTAVVAGLGLQMRFRYHLRARRLDALLPLARQLVEEAEWSLLTDDRITTARRHGLCVLLCARALELAEAGREQLAGPLVDEARELAERNLRQRVRALGRDHPDTRASRELVERLREVSREYDSRTS